MPAFDAAGDALMIWPSNECLPWQVEFVLDVDAKSTRMNGTRSSARCPSACRAAKAKVRASIAVTGRREGTYCATCGTYRPEDIPTGTLDEPDE